MRTNRSFAAATVGVLLLAGVARAAVTDHGITPDRQHFVQADLSPLFCLSWEVETGISRSQPLLVGDAIYHVGGPNLYGLRRSMPDTLWDTANPEAQLQLARLPGWPATGVQVQEGGTFSYSHPTYKDGIIYIGTSDPSVIAVEPATGAATPRELRIPVGSGEHPARLVSAPLAIREDLVAFGTTGGMLVSLAGLPGATSLDDTLKISGTLGKDVQTSLQETGNNWITGSFVPYPDNPKLFFAAVDAIADEEGGGLVGPYIIVEPVDIARGNSPWRRPGIYPAPLWAQPIRTPQGVTASLARDGQLLFFADKSGVFYSVQMRNGRQVWSSTLTTEAFTNNDPGIGIRHAYFVLRWLGARNQPTPAGALLALHKADGSLAWQAPLPAWGTTAPLVWQGPDGRERILVGDTAGSLTAWTAPPGQAPPGGGNRLNLAAAPTGSPAPIILTDPQTGLPIPCHQADQLAQDQAALAAAASHRVQLAHNPHPGDPERPYMPLAGAAVELSLDGDLLLAGVNTAPNATHPQGSGKLMAFRPVSNLKLEAEWARGGGLRLTVTNHSPEPASPVVAYGWATGPPPGPGQGLWPVGTLAPGQSRSTTVQLSPLPPAQATKPPPVLAVLSPYLYAHAAGADAGASGAGAGPDPEAGGASGGGAGAGAASLPPLPPAWQSALAPAGGPPGPEHPLYQEPREAYLADNRVELQPVPPVADFSVSTPADTCTPARFQDRSHHPLGVPITKHLWTNRPPGDQFDSAGRIPVVLQVVDALGVASDLAQQLVTVSPCTPPPEPATPDDPPGPAGNPSPPDTGDDDEEPLPVWFEEGDDAVSLDVSARPGAKAPRGVQVSLDIRVGLPDRYVVDSVAVYLPQVFQNISYCLGTGQCFTSDNTHTAAGGSGSTFRYDFTLAWTQNRPPDGDYDIWIVARGRRWWDETYTETHPNLVELPDGTVQEVEPPIEHVHTRTVEGTWEAEWVAGFVVEGHVYPYVQVENGP